MGAGHERQEVVVAAGSCGAMIRPARLLAVALFAALPGCSLFFDVAGRPEVKDVRTHVEKIDLRGVTLRLDADISNPYGVALKSPRLRYGLDVEGAEFVTAEEIRDIEIPARSVGTVTLPIRIEYASLLAAYKRLAGKNEFTYRAHGVFLLLATPAGDIELPVSKTGTAPVLRLPKFSNVRVEFSKVTINGATVVMEPDSSNIGVDFAGAIITGAGVIVEADVENTNSFDITTRDYGCRLTLGDTPVGIVTATTAGTIPAGETGHVTMKGQVSAAGILFQLIRGKSPGPPHLKACGLLETPYGTVNLQK